MRTINTSGYVLGAVLLALTAVTHAEPAAEPVVDASVRKVVWHVDFGEPRRLSAAAAAWLR